MYRFKYRDELDEALREFLLECKNVTRLRAATLRNYTAAYELFRKIMPEVILDTLNDEAVTDFFTRLDTRQRLVGRGEKRTGVKSSTVLTYCRRLEVFFKWMVGKGYLAKNPLENIKKPNVVYSDRQYLLKEDVLKIFSAVSRTIDWHSQLVRWRNTAIFSVLLNTGLRRGELIGLRVTDLDFKRWELTVRAETSKSKMERVLPITTALRKDLDDYLEERKKRKYTTPALFVSETKDDGLTLDGLKHMIERVVDKSGVNFHLHQFRHTFAINVLTKSNNVKLVQELLGHTDIRMTSKYLRCLPTEFKRTYVEGLGNLDSLV
jgi:site-specific recombinase XerD